MAISNDLLVSKFGVSFTDVYYRILRTALSRDDGSDIRFWVTIDLSGYAVKPEAGAIPQEVDYRRYHVPLVQIEAQVGDNLLAKSYVWVMAQPGMAKSLAV